MNYILYDIASGLVENVLVWDGSSPYRIPQTKQLGHDATGKIWIGWTKTGQSFVSPDTLTQVAASNVTIAATGTSPF
jgi:hypothetical protein